jgi:hypothetical protein
MLWTIAVILLILWLLGFFAFHVGSIIHVLLVIAIIVILYRIITGRRPVVCGRMPRGNTTGGRPITRPPFVPFRRRGH